MRNYVVLFVLLALCCACHTTGPVSASLATGAAAVTAVFDQLLAGGVIDPVQHLQVTHGLQAIDQATTAVQTGLAAVQKAQEGSLTTGEAAAAAGGLTATVLGAVRAWRGPATKTRSA